MSNPRYAANALRGFATGLLQRAGLAAERAQVVAEVLVEADLLGHDTHGLDMLARYLDELLAGGRRAPGREGDRLRPAQAEEMEPRSWDKTHHSL